MKLILLLAVCLAGQTFAGHLTSSLKEILKSQKQSDIIVNMKEGNAKPLAQLNSKTFADRNSKLNQVFVTLRAHRDQSQKNVIDLLNKNGVEYESFWVSNQIFVKKADNILISKLVQFQEIGEIYENFEIPLERTVVEPAQDNGVFYEWGLATIQAQEAWDAYTTGNGTVVGIIDTGSRYTHEALVNNWVGIENKGWYDPYDRSPMPIDQNGHGTHVAGTILGSHGIGVAPGAHYLACRGCSTSSCTVDALTSCGQFMACPHGPAGPGDAPDCSKAPRLVSNSWGGGAGQTFFNPVIATWVANDIIPVFSNGNNGPSCGSGGYPGVHEDVIGCGATAQGDSLASFSSKGPYQGVIKPDVCGPGASVRSAYHTSDTAYSTLSGTSMSAPHVSGTIALMLARNPSLNTAQVKERLYSTTQRGLPSTGSNCGGIEETVYPNNAFGWGRINAFRAVGAA